MRCDNCDGIIQGKSYSNKFGEFCNYNCFAEFQISDTCMYLCQDLNLEDDDE